MCCYLGEYRDVKEVRKPAKISSGRGNLLSRVKVAPYLCNEALIQK